MDILETALVALMGGFVAGGSLAAIGYRAFKDRLIEDLAKVFAKRSYADGLGAKIADIDAKVGTLFRKSDAAHESVIRLQEADKYTVQPILDRLTSIDRKLEKFSDVFVADSLARAALETRVRIMESSKPPDRREP